jgi:hypothetical protein
MGQYVSEIGSTSLGVVIGFLVRYFIRRFNSFSASVLSSVITIILGGAVIKFIEADKTVWWFYPIGLLLGFVAYQIIATRAIESDRTYYREEYQAGRIQPRVLGKDDPRLGDEGIDEAGFKDKRGFHDPR